MSYDPKKDERGETARAVVKEFFASTGTGLLIFLAGVALLPIAICPPVYLALMAPLFAYLSNRQLFKK